jgi:hypothetical protein
MKDYIVKLASRAALYKCVARLMLLTDTKFWVVSQTNPDVQCDPDRMFVRGVIFVVNGAQVLLQRQPDAADEWDLRADGIVVFDCFGNLTQEMADMIA